MAPDDALALAAALVKHWEGLRLAPYLCPAGFATIGWGTHFYPDGRRVALDDPAISQSQANEFLGAALAKIWGELKSRLTRAPTAHQAAALISLGYNIGAGALAGSTLIAEFNAGDARAAAAEFSRWCHGRVNGKETVIEGLLQRREAEAALFLMPDDEP